VPKEFKSIIQLMMRAMRAEILMDIYTWLKNGSGIPSLAKALLRQDLKIKDQSVSQ
jgi:hypothetical protein